MVGKPKLLLVLFLTCYSCLVLGFLQTLLKEKTPKVSEDTDKIQNALKKPNCKCQSGIGSFDKSNFLCPGMSRKREGGQKVISYSFFGPIRDSKGFLNWYAQGIQGNAEMIPNYYGPEWTMRVYHDEIIDEEKFNFFCNLSCRHQHVDFCQTSGVQGLLEGIGDLEPTLWRFTPLSDPKVDEFHSRDLDSRPSDRETAALKEFQESDMMFHIMRDHREHYAAILAGLWGAKTWMNRTLIRATAVRMAIAAQNNHDKGNKFTDQVILQNEVFPMIKDSTLTHASFHCGSFRTAEFRPFPTQRKEEAYNFVGFQMFANKEPLRDVCPPPCRPKNHQDWLGC